MEAPVWNSLCSLVSALHTAATGRTVGTGISGILSSSVWLVPAVSQQQFSGRAHSGYKSFHHF